MRTQDTDESLQKIDLWLRLMTEQLSQICDLSQRSITTVIHEFTLVERLFISYTVTFNSQDSIEVEFCDTFDRSSHTMQTRSLKEAIKVIADSIKDLDDY
jgi:hypothetical protein